MNIRDKLYIVGYIKGITRVTCKISEIVLLVLIILKIVGVGNISILGILSPIIIQVILVLLGLFIRTRIMDSISKGDNI
jgi:hypothetical protein